jgi:hypothetical protein
MSEPRTIRDCLSSISDADLSAFLRALDHIVGQHRNANRAQAVAWYRVLIDAGEADQRWRNGNLDPEGIPYWEERLVEAACALSDAEIEALRDGYQALFYDGLGLPIEHPLTILGGICAILLDLEAERRATPVVA